MSDSNEPNHTIPLPPGQIPTIAASDAGAPRPAFGPPLAAGEVGTLGPYRVLKELGKGGMGAVYLALDTRLDRELALKVMPPAFAADPAARERFLREAKAAAKIAHDNVVTVYEADERDGVPYIAMQRLRGCSLDAYLNRRGRPALPQVVRVARDAAAGLAAAHGIRLIHRDVKPANLWLEAPGGRVKVLDFGLARPLDAEDGLTRSGAVIGTPAYMSPEQARGLPVDHRTDLWSLGVVLYQLCTGVRPFRGPNAMAVLLALGTEEPTPVRELNPDVPEPLAALTHELLAKNPAARPPTADAVVRRLDALAAGPTDPAAPPAPNPERAGAFADIDPTEEQSGTVETIAAAAPAPPRSYRWAWGLGAGAGAALLVVAALLALSGLTRGPKGVPPSPGPSADLTPAVPVPVGKKTEPPAAAKEPAADDDRRAAERVLKLGGSVRVNGETRDRATPADLPEEPFRLTEVRLNDNRKVTDAGLETFRGLKYLTYINVAYTSVGNAGLAHLKDVKTLATLMLARTNVTDDGLTELQGLDNLTALNVSLTRVGNGGLFHLRGHRKLTRLFLNSSRVTDAGLFHLKGHQNLTTLHLHQTNVTDAGLAHLKGLERLTALTLHGTEVTDAGLDQLMEFKNLTSLDLSSAEASGRRLTAANIAELKRALPGCDVRLNSDPVGPPK
jgi:hypothetical protein